MAREGGVLAVTAVWLALMAACVGTEAIALRHGSRTMGLRRVVSALWARPLWRIPIVAAWAFVGWHVFARYTLAA